MKQKIGWIFILTFKIFVCFSQNETNIATFGKFKGTENYRPTINDSLKTGQYSFISDLIPQLTNDTFSLTQLSINGNYAQNQPHGTWKYKYDTYILQNFEIKNSRQVLLHHQLSGSEREFNLQYNKGSLHGTTSYKQHTLLNAKFGNTTQLAEMHFENDTLKGNFFLNTDGFSMQGHTNQEGFLDGLLELHYKLNNQAVTEKRLYKNGFLLELEKTHDETGKMLTKIIYDDVITRLNQLEKNEQILNYNISEKYFGPKFNLGYRPLDKKITSQRVGNNLLEKHLTLFDSIHNLHFPQDSKQCVFKLTRRFQNIYSPVDDSLTKHLSIINTSLQNKTKTYLNKPNIVLRKNNSDSLFIHYQTLKHINSKTDTLQKVFEKIENGYFQYRSRQKFYTNGISGTNQIDTIHCILNGNTIEIPFQIQNQITHSDSLLQQIQAYLHELNKKAEHTIEKLTESLIFYKNQEKIDSLDKNISTLEALLAQQYPEITLYQKSEIAKMPFHYKIIISFNERLIDPLKNKYLSNSLSQDEVISAGNSLICYYTFLTQSKEILSKIGNFQKHWNDSLFTLYRDNPFDSRKLESKILESVQSTSGILLRQYANQLLNAKSCSQLDADLQKIILLNERVKFLTKNHGAENVQKLNKALRRERIPNRIERLLEL